MWTTFRLEFQTSVFSITNFHITSHYTKVIQGLWCLQLRKHEPAKSLKSTYRKPPPLGTNITSVPAFRW